MNKENFNKLITVLDKEIKAYTTLKELFEEKRELLKKAKSGDLGTIDNKILSVNNLITKLNNTRKNISSILIDENAKMSQFIELAEQNAPEFVEPLTERKVKICKLFEELALLNSQNVELIKHGIVMTNKMLETIVDAFAPQGSNYNGAGKTDTRDLDMWTINEEI